MRPMLSAKFDLDFLEDQLASLPYPMLASPKIDGYRCLINDRGPHTRKLLPWPNKFVRELLTKPELVGFDGELVIGAPHSTCGDQVFHRSSALLRHDDPVADMSYYVFDSFNTPKADYIDRLMQLKESFPFMSYIHYLEQVFVESADDVLQYEKTCLEQGYEGCMLRSIVAPYKYGRSTFSEAGMIKLKRTTVGIGTIVGFNQKYHNANEAQVDELGYTKRSSEAHNQVPLPMLGSWTVCCPDFNLLFNVGSGFTEQQSTDWWRDPRAYIGSKIYFRYLRHGMKDAPRHPVFLKFLSD